jgi:GYF domain 2
MKYYIKRDLNEYGPYTLADVQRYVAQGNILMTDLARSEGLTEWVPVSQVLGNIPVPVQAPAMPGAVGTVYGGTSGYGVAASPALAAGPTPPDFHWALVLLLGFVTCGLFWWAWLIVEAVWIRKIKPQSNGMLLVLLSLGCSLGGGIINGVISAMSHGNDVPFGGLFSLAGWVLAIVGTFTMRSDLEDYYNTTENIGLSLSGVMTFFFAVFYFQHHFSRIAQWKKTGVLQPQ